MTSFTDRFSRAVDYARIAHVGQVRKGTRVPYLSHVLGVAALVVWLVVRSVRRRRARGGGSRA